MLEAATIVLLVLLTAVYAGGISQFVRGLRTALARPGASSGRPSVSVVIAARNEESTIGECLRSVLECDYPRYEVIVLDDGSVDRTASVVEAVARENQDATASLGLVRLGSEAEAAGKFRAIAHGIALATGDIIVTLDADCRVRRGWLRALASYMTDDVGFVSGAVDYEDSEGLLRRIEALEFMSLIGVGAGAIGMGRPLICNSANAAYRRSLYEQMMATQPPADFSAADELLMKFVHESTPYRVAFCASPDGLVTTRGADSIPHFLSQRMRWVSMVRHLPLFHRLGVLVAFAYFVLLTTGLVVGSHQITLGTTALASLLVKTAADWRLLETICSFFGRRNLLRVLPAAELLYLPYALIVGPAGTLRSPDWKGRSAQSRSDQSSRSTLPVRSVDAG